ncbi:hypothetical protein HMI54_015678 [Coelomomyces lativittatus]|nr:hypothetical protein HMI54_015678 [Coelomomyces lativittatus]
MEDDISYFNFHFELSGPIHQLLTFIGTLPSYSSPPSYLLEPLKSLLQTSSSNDTPLLNNQISSLLESLTELLVYPDLTLEILTFFRPCIIDLVSRSIHSIKTDIRITRAPSLSNTKRKGRITCTKHSLHSLL